MSDEANQENSALSVIEQAVRNLSQQAQRTEIPLPTGEAQHMRILEAILFAATEPLDMESIRARMPQNADCNALLARMQVEYETRGVNLVRVADKWRLQTAPDLAHRLVDEREEPRKLSTAALETLAIIAYHQPVTRAEIEEVRGVAVSRGTLDLLLELDWIGLKGRRRTPGRPLTWGTTESFLSHFNLERIEDLPGKDELKAAGLLDSRVPKEFEIPTPVTGGGEDDLLPVDEESQDPEFHMDYLDEAVMDKE